MRSFWNETKQNIYNFSFYALAHAGKSVEKQMDLGFVTGFVTEFVTEFVTGMNGFVTEFVTGSIKVGKMP